MKLVLLYRLSQTMVVILLVNRKNSACYVLSQNLVNHVFLCHNLLSKAAADTKVALCGLALVKRSIALLID